MFEFIKNFANCPWDNFMPATFAFMEDNRCGWVAEPANTYSNIAYLLVGIYILFISRKKRWQPINYFGVVAILIGLTSGLYHASCTFLFQVMDVASMFLISCLLLTLNLRRLHLIRRGWVYVYYWSMVILSIVALVVFHKFGRLLFTVQILVAIALEMRMIFTHRDKITPRGFFYALGFFVLSYVFWVLDLKELISRPENHVFQGHALWHIANAISLPFLYKYYSQFNIAPAHKCTGDFFATTEPCRH